MTAMLDVRHPHPADPLRLTRALAARVGSPCTATARIADASQARGAGRGDVALALLDGLAPADADSRAALVLRARTLVDLGRPDDALVATARSRRLHGDDPEILALLFDAARLAGTWIPADLGDTTFARVLTSADAAGRAELWRAIPFARLPFAFARHAVVTLAAVDPAAARRFAIRWIGAAILQLLSHLSVAAAFGALGVASGGRTIHVAALGKFTRLADLVDKIDPILRRLEADGGAARHRLFVFYFGGYPNATLFDLVRRRVVLVNATTRIRRKLANLALAALRRADRLTPATTDYRVIGPPMRDLPAVLRLGDGESAALGRRLETMGIDPTRRFIVFGLRDMAYYRFYGEVMDVPLENQGRRAATHHRCPPLATYAAAAQAWAEQGHQVLRMGLRVSEALPGNLDPRVIDYASGNRDDALDAFLFTKCWFMIAGDTGLFSGAAAFDRPSVLSDLYLIQNTMYSSARQAPNVFVPKLYRDDETGEFLSFRETVWFNHSFATHEACAQLRVSVVHNEAADILDASRELVARLDGHFEESAEDRERQAAFRAIYQPGHIGYKSTALVSSAFLRRYEKLLDAR